MEKSEQSGEKQASPADRIKPWQFQPGQSGNPAGRPPGRTLKDYAKKYLAGMTDDERNEFLKGIDKKVIWEMTEGKAHQTTDITTDGKALPQPLLAYVQTDNSTEEDTSTEEED